MPLVATPGRAAVRVGGNDFLKQCQPHESSDRFKTWKRLAGHILFAWPSRKLELVLLEGISRGSEVWLQVAAGLRAGCGLKPYGGRTGW